jgi:hypothetical protein
MQCARECGDFVLEGDMDKLDKKLQLKIAKELRKIVSDVDSEPIPPRLAALLDRDEPPPFGGANGARQPVEKKRVNAVRRYDRRG